MNFMKNLVNLNIAIVKYSDFMEFLYYLQKNLLLSARKAKHSKNCNFSSAGNKLLTIEFHELKFH